MLNREKQCTTPGCQKHVYATDLCRRHYNLKRWHSDYETERRRLAKETGRKPQDIPRRGPQMKDPEQRRNLLREIETARVKRGFEVCQVPGCEEKVRGGLGICHKHYQRERLLRDQLGMPPRADERRKPDHLLTKRAQRVRSRSVPSAELNVRQEAARRGVPPGVVAAEWGVPW